MEYNQIDDDFIGEIQSFLGENQFIYNNPKLNDYASDYTEDLHFVPSLVVFPESALEVSKIVSLAGMKNIPITPRGAGTGLSGGALPVYGGIVISTERMNKILSIDAENFQVVVEPGVINDALKIELEKYGLYYPPDPASKGSCFLGGNIAHNSGGPRALKYGVTRDFVLNLEVVLPNGEIIWTGANTLKNSTGYSITHLMIGSEGTLGIVTKIVFKVIPLPKNSQLLLAGFTNAKQACAAVAPILISGANPSAIEFMEKRGIEISAQHLGLNFDFMDACEAYLLIEVDGNDWDAINKETELIAETLYQNQAFDVLLADSADKKEHFWKIRRAIGETVKATSIYKEEDTVVPRAQLPDLLSGVKEIGLKYGFESVCYGHAGDGNLHVNILKGNLSDEFWNGDLKLAIKEIFELCKKLGGTISGEHGIGLVQKEYMPIMFSDFHLQLMRDIKKVFDPKNILNPGKIF